MKAGLQNITKIGIVDDNKYLISAVIEKLSFFDNIQVEFTAQNGVDALEKLKIHSEIDVILMDIEMPIMNGIEATNYVKSLYPNIKIVILTVFDNDENIFNAIKAGADGYLLKDIDPQSLYQGIAETLNGGAAMNPSIALKTLQLLRNPEQFEDKKTSEVTLTKSEVAVLEQLSQGLKYTTIAENLFVAPKTIRKHIENIYKKLQVHSKHEAITKAQKNKLI